MKAVSLDQQTIRLTPEEVSYVTSHKKSCAICAQVYDKLRFKNQGETIALFHSLDIDDWDMRYVNHINQIRMVEV